MILKLGYDSIWFGVVLMVVLEMEMISPPVGLNVFVVKGIAGDTPMRHVFAGILPFWIALGVLLVVLVIFPDFALSLPNSMFGKG